MQLRLSFFSIANPPLNKSSVRIRSKRLLEMALKTTILNLLIYLLIQTNAWKSLFIFSSFIKKRPCVLSQGFFSTSS